MNRKTTAIIRTFRSNPVDYSFPWTLASSPTTENTPFSTTIKEATWDERRYHDSHKLPCADNRHQASFHFNFLLFFLKRMNEKMKRQLLYFEWKLFHWLSLPCVHDHLVSPSTHSVSSSSPEFYPPILFPLPFCRLQSLLAESPLLRKSVMIRRVQERRFLAYSGNRPQFLNSDLVHFRSL